MPSRSARTNWPRPLDKVIPLNDAAAAESHHGAASPARQGHTQHAVTGIGCDSVDLIRRRHQPKVDCPAHRGGRRVDLSVDAVRRVLAQPPRHRGGQARRGPGGVGAELGQQESAGAERALVPPRPGSFRPAVRPVGRRSVRRRESSPERSVLPTIWSQPTISGSASPVRPNRPTSSSSYSTESSEISSDRLAVDASVTNAPHNRCTSQVSVVVTTPVVVMFARIHAIFGAEKRGRAPDPVAPRWCPPMVARRSTRPGGPRINGRCWSAPGVAVPREHGFALVGEGHGRDGNSRPAPGLSGRVDDRVEQRFRVLLDLRRRSRYSGRTATSAIETTCPASSTTMAFVPEVPWSIARKWCMIALAILCRLSLQLGIDRLHTRHGQSALAAGRQQVAEIARTDDHHHDDVRPRLLETRVPNSASSKSATPQQPPGSGSPRRPG